MALRLRRGTNAERLLVTPLEGELIYTTDTKVLYIGDGVTQGGLQVTGAFPESINDLSDVDIANFIPEVGQVLKWNGTEFIPADIVGQGQQANVDIISDDSTVLVDSETQNFQGNIFTGNTFIGDLFNGSFVGDGSGLTNINGGGIIEGADYRINIIASDLTVLVDTDTQTFNGNFEGNLVGDIKGSVFGDDSSILVDAINGTLNTPGVSITDNQIINKSFDHFEIVTLNDLSSTLTLYIPNGGSLRLNAYKGTYDLKEDTIPGDLLNNIRFSGYREGTNRFLGGIVSQWDDDVNFLTQLPAGKIVLYAGSNGSQFNFATFSGLDGTFEAPVLKTGSYLNAADRDAKIITPEDGMIILLADDGTGNPKFQGYNGTAWVNIG
jgi:hypothetical protein